MDAAEQRWRAGAFVPTHANPEPNEDSETTLIPDQDISLSETLTENNANVANLNLTVDDSNDPAAGSNANDSGFDGNDSKLGDDSKQFESLIEDDVPVVNESGDGDEVFEDCLDDENDGSTLKSPGKHGKNDVGNSKADFDRVDEKYSIEMKLALGIEDNEG
ncbi:Uncharacterized protein OBRU01_11286 [Operophtera brumata]|uniref:Uncharacterized protein n=1 Tax=Operophtera brumata TaxID=104452 RepID=A0A0L7LCA4_OPEBR|nr:Uncharacterized protein OBRU01_11286 [Operophtera brumata]